MIENPLLMEKLVHVWDIVSHMKRRSEENVIFVLFVSGPVCSHLIRASAFFNDNEQKEVMCILRLQHHPLIYNFLLGSIYSLMSHQAISNHTQPKHFDN